MRQPVFPESGRFYKANLHCHSTCSDGKLTPEELKTLYKAAGYSVLAYSDHNVLIDHTDLNDPDFLALTSVEIDVNRRGEEPYARRPCYHINFYPSDPHQVALPCFNPKYVFGKRTDLRDAQPYIGMPDYTREYDRVSELIDEFAKHGFLAMLNHATWSLQTMKDYERLDLSSVFGFEMYNHGCYVLGFDEVNSHLYDELLRRGNKLFCTATDDNHNHVSADSPTWDSLGGFVMIKARELTHQAICAALKNGDFYASTGPLIHELYIEDGTLHFKTSPAKRVTLTTSLRQAKIRYPEQGALTLTEGSFGLDNVGAGYVRLTVYAEDGTMAWSQPLFGDFSGA